MKSLIKIKNTTKHLQKIATDSKNPFESRIAQAMAYALVWATEKTAGSNTPAVEAMLIAEILQSESNSKKIILILKEDGTIRHE